MELTYGIVPAAGYGQRFGGSVPKQFSIVKGRPLLSYTIESLLRSGLVDMLYVVIPEDYGNVQGLCCNNADKVVFVQKNASSRQSSIADALQAIQRDGVLPSLVVLHDGVRPRVPADEAMVALLAAARDDGAAGFVRPLVSTVVTADRQTAVMTSSLRRADYRNCETPQAFRYTVFRDAYFMTDTDGPLTGSGCLQLIMQNCSIRPRLLEADEDLWKVTYPKDLHAFRGLLNDQLRICLLPMPEMGAFCQGLLDHMDQLPGAFCESSGWLHEETGRLDALVLLCSDADLPGTWLPHLSCAPGLVVDVCVHAATLGSRDLQWDQSVCLWSSVTEQWGSGVGCCRLLLHSASKTPMARLASLLTAIVTADGSDTFDHQVLYL